MENIQSKIAKIYTKKTENRHPFHLVDPSPWPLFGSISALSLTFGGVMYMHNYQGGGFLFTTGFFCILYTMYLWWRDIIREGTFEGQHTQEVKNGLKLGFQLFIVSEIMLFFAFFWAFFDASIKPSFAIGGVWPPEGIEPLNPWGIPLLNTVILLSSGATVTWAHNAMLWGSKKSTQQALGLTIFLAFIFTCLQVYEYIYCPFSMSSSVFGSVFFLATGFHGLHVCIGTIFLFINFLRISKNHFTKQHHIGFETAIWYWHFVDIVWVFLFVAIYWWGS